MPPPRLRDPHAGPANAAAYLHWWGDHLYRDHCARVGTPALPYADFCARTLAEGKDWWVLEAEGEDLNAVLLQEPQVPLQESQEGQEESQSYYYKRQ